MAINVTRDPLDICQEFLSRSTPQRFETLQNMGLERYHQLLCHLTATEANYRCLRRFLINPHQVKFPQLQGADLRGLNLQQMNLVRAKFNQALLQGCCLRSADLIFGDFTGADLSNADLRGCTVNESQWRDAVVTHCDLRGTVGLTPQQQQVLYQKGAILD
ncbi:MAG: pentapeptide repeat-containing protein [Candidatus Nanopelagicaceae bacterium]